MGVKEIAFLLFACLAVGSHGQNNPLSKFAEWKEMEFEFPSDYIKQNLSRTGQYIRGSSVPIDVDIDYKTRSGESRVFVTIPKFNNGIPVTLGVLTGRSGPGGPIIRPYPDWSWQADRNCNGIISVARIFIDECSRLWVLDMGKIVNDQVCPMKLMVFDLYTDKLIRSYPFPRDQVNRATLMITPIVDVRDPRPGGTCSNTMVYIADSDGAAVYVYSYAQDYSWYFKNPFTEPKKEYNRYVIAGESFVLNDGAFGLAISPKNFPERYLFFHPLADIKEYAVPLRVIDDYRNFYNNPQNAVSGAFKEVGNRRTASTVEVFDKTGNMFFATTAPSAVACWDSQRPYNWDNMRYVASDEQTLQFTGGLKVVINKRGEEELWVLTNRFQKLMTGSMTVNEVNFRIQAASVQKLLNGNKCIAR